MDRCTAVRAVRNKRSEAKVNKERGAADQEMAAGTKLWALTPGTFRTGFTR